MMRKEIGSYHAFVSGKLARSGGQILFRREDWLTLVRAVVGAKLAVSGWPKPFR